MRVTGGNLRGRIIKVHGDCVRPTQDRVREALFSIIGAEVVASRFLDLYAGSGVVGLEAWSRGAEFVCWVEVDKGALRGLRESVSGFCDIGAKVVGGDVVKVLKRGLDGEQPFDIIFADPPYLKKEYPTPPRQCGASGRRKKEEGNRDGSRTHEDERRETQRRQGNVGQAEGGEGSHVDVVAELLGAVDAGGVMKSGGLFVMEQRVDVRAGVVNVEGWDLVKEKSYGHTALSFFRKDA